MMPALFARNSQFISFALIGVANTLIHGLILVLMIEKLLLGVTLSHLLAFCVANMFSYILNSKLTFKSRLTVGKYVRFFLASLGALCLTLILSWLVDMNGLHYLIGFALIVVLVPLLSFCVMKFWIFSSGAH